MKSLLISLNGQLSKVDATNYNYYYYYITIICYILGTNVKYFNELKHNFKNI